MEQLGAVVVEDNEDVAQLVKALLEDDPRLVVVAIVDNAQAAIESAREHQPALVILDHALKGPTTGIRAAAAVKEHAPNTRIILFSAYPVEEEAANEPAIDAVLTKVEFAQLLPVARELLDLGPVGP